MKWRASHNLLKISCITILFKYITNKVIYKSFSRVNMIIRTNKLLPFFWWHIAIITKRGQIWHMVKNIIYMKKLSCQLLMGLLKMGEHIWLVFYQNEKKRRKWKKSREKKYFVFKEKERQCIYLIVYLIILKERQGIYLIIIYLIILTERQCIYLIILKERRCI